MRESPRIRRLHTDQRALEALKEESTIIDFKPFGEPPEKYKVRFYGRGLTRESSSSPVLVHEMHEVTISLGASYPRVMPELQWKTPIYHPNISAAGIVCLGGYGTHWVPSLNLDEMCEMLWDMIRYANYDISSPYNREAADWAGQQREYDFPVDPRPIRDKLSGQTPPPDKEEDFDEVLFLGDEQLDLSGPTRQEPPDVLYIE